MKVVIILETDMIIRSDWHTDSDQNKNEAQK